MGSSGDPTPNMFRILAGFVLGILFVPAAVLVWFYRAPLPVAVADPPLTLLERAGSTLLERRIGSEMVELPPLEPDEPALVAGARIYVDRCAFCHGLPGRGSLTGDSMYPAARQLWASDPASDAVGVSNEPAGETFWKVLNGIRHTGMPEFRSQISETEIWEVTLLIAHADKPLPAAAVGLLRAGGGSAAGSGRQGYGYGPAGRAPEATDGRE